jgi:hypothetical protein
MDVRVVTPWRPDGAERSALWAFCSRWWKARGVVPIVSPSPEGPFNRGAAINAGLDGTWDAAIVLDADVVCPQDLVAGVLLAANAERLVLPYERYVGLAPWGMRRVLAGDDIETAGALRVVDDHESSIIIIPRAVWDEAGGFDPRFVGWGQDDVAFCQTCRILTGEPLRMPGNVYHLWHPPADEKWPGDPLWDANQALGAKYRVARTREDLEALGWNAPPSSLTSTSATHGTASTA